MRGKWNGLQVLFAKMFRFAYYVHCLTHHFQLTLVGVSKEYKSQDILNAMHLVPSTKTILQKFKEHGWEPLFEKVKLFYKDHEIEVPNLSAPYKGDQGWSRIQRDNLKIEHHYQFDIFIASIDSLLTEMNSHFNDNVIEFLFNWSIFNLMLIKAQSYRLVLTFPMSTATTEQAFSTMKIMKTRFCNKMEDDFNSTYLVAYIKKEIAREFLTDSIINEFNLMKKRRVRFKMLSIEK
ncbi:hypothetical protein V6Z11_A05G336300 [Gossypium hirsutum]